MTARRSNASLVKSPRPRGAPLEVVRSLDWRLASNDFSYAAHRCPRWSAREDWGVRLDIRLAHELTTEYLNGKNTV